MYVGRQSEVKKNWVCIAKFENYSFAYMDPPLTFYTNYSFILLSKCGICSSLRSWVKIYKIMRRDGATKTNLSDFYLITDFSKYNDPRPSDNRSTDPLVVLFEWKSPTYEYIEDILSTTIWNTLGSLAGVFVTLIKAGEYFYAWIKRMRRSAL